MSEVDYQHDMHGANDILLAEKTGYKRILQHDRFYYIRISVVF